MCIRPNSLSIFSDGGANKHLWNKVSCKFWGGYEDGGHMLFESEPEADQRWIMTAVKHLWLWLPKRQINEVQQISSSSANWTMSKSKLIWVLAKNRSVARIWVIKARKRRMRSQYRLIESLREPVIIPKTLYVKLYVCIDHLDKIWISRLMVEDLAR